MISNPQGVTPWEYLGTFFEAVEAGAYALEGENPSVMLLASLPGKRCIAMVNLKTRREVLELVHGLNEAADTVWPEPG